MEENTRPVIHIYIAEDGGIYGGFNGSPSDLLELLINAKNDPKFAQALRMLRDIEALHNIGETIKAKMN